MAAKYATYLHANQSRKYTGLPYITHLAEVAGLVAAAVAGRKDCDSMVSAAFLHDAMEDQGASYLGIKAVTCADVADIVVGLTDIEEGTRAERKYKAALRLAASDWRVQTIKYADLISNTRDIVKHDPKFAVVYLAEKKHLLDVMRDGHRGLRNMALAQLERCYASLKS